jgi:POTRA domain, FtsQ-type
LKSKILGVVSAALFLVLCGWLYSRQGVLRLASVDIENVEDKDLVVAVKRKIVPYLGANLLTLSLADLQKSLQQDVRIKKVFIGRKLPSTLNIKIIERIPVAKYFQGSKEFVVSDEGMLIEGMQVKEVLPIWVHFSKTLPSRKLIVANWLEELRQRELKYFNRISEFEWIENRGLVLSVLSRLDGIEGDVTPELTYVQVDMGTDNFSQRWRRLKLVLDWMLEQQIQGERLIALDDGQVVISGVKNLHNLKNELNLKEIVRRATPQSDTRVQAR